MAYHMSPFNKLTLDTTAKERAKISEDARFYAFAHARCEWPASLAMVPDDELPADLVVFRRGAYCYFDQDQRLLHMNAVTETSPPSCGVLNFQTPGELSEDATDALFRAGRFVPVVESRFPVTYVGTADGGTAPAKWWVAWIRPNERIVEGAPPFFPHGTWAFAFRDWADQAGIKGVTFAVRGRKF